jgi:hypothetical protein
MGFNEWFRKHQKKFYVILGVLIMVTWYMSTSVEQLLSSATGKRDVIYGKKISPADLDAVMRRLQALMLRAPDSQAVLRAWAWEHLILAREADRMGLEATEEEVAAVLAARFASRSGSGPDPVLYRNQLRNYQLSEGEFEQSIKERIKIAKLQGMVLGSAKVSDDEAWHRYAYDNEQVQVKYAELSPRRLTRLITLTEDEMKTFHEQHMDVFPKDSPDHLGYRVPEKVKIEYLLVPNESFERDAIVTMRQIRKYYEDRKELYKQPPKPAAEAKPAEASTLASPPGGEQKATDSGKPAESAASPAGATPDKPGEARPAAAPAAPAGAEPVRAGGTDAEQKPEEPGKKDEPAYRPLEEVRGEIESLLRREAAAELAAVEIERVDRAIAEEMSTVFGSAEHKYVDFKAFEKKFRVEYGMTDHFSDDDLPKALAGAWNLPKEAFGQSMDAIRLPRSIMKAARGRFIFQLLDIKPPRASAFEEVREKVKADLLLKKAHALAEETVRAAIAAAGTPEPSFEKAVQEAEARLAALEPKGNPGSGGEEAKAIPPDASRDPGNKPGEDEPKYKYVTVETKGFLTRARDRGTEFGRIAFGLEDGRLGVAVEEADKDASYLLMVVARKHADRKAFDAEKEEIVREITASKQGTLLEAWLQAVRRRANPSESVLAALGQLPGWKTASKVAPSDQTESDIE